MTLILIPALVGSSSTGGVAGVETFEGRQGAVTIQTGDATSSEITNVSSVPGATVTAALDKLSTDLAGLAAGISDWQASVKTVTNTPPGSPAAGDRYLIGSSPTGAWASNAKNIAQWNGSAWAYTAPAAGMATIADDTVHIWAYRASDTTWVDLGGFTAPVTTVFGRQGAVAATAGDYTATQVTNTPSGGISATTVQAALNELDTEKADKTTTMTAGAGLVGGGDLSGNRSFAVGAGNGITVNADDVAMSDMAQATLKGRASGAGTGAPQDLTPTQARTLLNVADGATAAGATGDAYATSHEADATAHAAANIVNTPAGGVAATTVQAAINELDAEKQPLDATLTALAGVTTAADKMIYATGADAFATTDLTAFARTVLDDADAATALATLGAATSTHNHDASYVPLTRTVTGANSLTGGGDGTANRTLSLVNDAASPGNNMLYGSDGAGNKGWFARSGSGGTVTNLDAGSLAYNNSTTSYTLIKSVPVDATKYEVVGTQIEHSHYGVFNNANTTSRTARFQLQINGTLVATAISTASTTATNKSVRLSWETWRIATGIAGRWTVLVAGLAVASGTCADYAVAMSGTITFVVNGSVSTTNGSLDVTYYSVDRVGTASGAGTSQRIVNTMTGLHAVDPATASLTANELCYVRGFASPGDGGEGYFLWDAASAAADDGGMVIRPDTAPANGRWLRQTSGDDINVKWFGAKGDGASNDAPAIQAAIGTGRAVFLPEGDYKINAALTYDWNKPLVMRGAYGRDYHATRILDGRANSDEPMVHHVEGWMRSDGTYDNGAGGNKTTEFTIGEAVHLEQINFLCGGTNPNGSCVEIDGVQNAYVANCKFTAAQRGLTFGSEVFGNVVHHCEFDGIFLKNGNHDPTFQDTTVRAKALRSWGLGAQDHTYAYGIDVAGWGTGVYLSGENCVLSGARIEECGYGLVAGLGTWEPAYVGLRPGLLSRASITGLSFEANVIGVYVSNIAATQISGVGVHGSVADIANGDRHYESEVGFEVVNAAQNCKISAITAQNHFIKAAVINASPCPIEGLIAADSAGFPAVGMQQQALVTQQGEAINPHRYSFPGVLMFPDATNVRHQTITAFHDLMVPGLTGINIRDRAASGNAQGGPIFAKNLGGVVTPANGATTAAVTFRAEIGAGVYGLYPGGSGPQTAAPSLTAGDYWYATTVVAPNGETGIDYLDDATSQNYRKYTVGAGQNVRINTYGDFAAAGTKRRIYRGRKKGWFEGYWEQSVADQFVDNGTVPFDGKGMPPFYGSIPPRTEDDANYQIIATPSWGTTVHVTSKTTGGFTLNFGTAAPDGSQTVAWMLFRP